LHYVYKFSQTFVSCLPLHTLRVAPAAHAEKKKLERMNTVITVAPQPSGACRTMAGKRLEERVQATEKRLQALAKRLQAMDREIEIHTQQNATNAQKGAMLKQKGTALVQAQKGTARNAEAAAGVAAGVAAHLADLAELSQQLAALGVASKDSGLRCAELRRENLRCAALHRDAKAAHDELRCTKSLYVSAAQPR